MTQVRTKGFVKVIQDKMFEGNEFLTKFTNHNQFVNDYQVEVPQAGTIAAISKDRSVLPAVIGQRTDTTLTYDLGEYTTDPILIKNIEKIQLSYDKMRSVLNHFLNKMNETIGDYACYDCATDTTTRHIYTTGTATANIAPPSGTGNRNAVDFTDMSRLQALFDNDKGIPQNGRYILMPSTMYHNMITENVEFHNDQYLPDQDAIKLGAVKKIFGFNVIIRPSVVVYSSGIAKKAVGAAGAAGDLFGALAWQEDYLARALGAIKFFAAKDIPEYYGDVYSALVMFAATRLRTDQAGVGMLIQA